MALSRSAFPSVQPLRLNVQKIALDTPALIPPNSLDGQVPAFFKWFTPLGRKWDHHKLKGSYFQRFRAAPVSLEYTGPDPEDPQKAKVFRRFNAPLGAFLDYLEKPPSNTSLYLAQFNVADLPKGLRKDLPKPSILRSFGKGDVYGQSIWIGYPPTMTPLHRDPNPNVFVQLAGTKKIRLFPPEVGQEIFRNVKTKIGSGGDMSGRIRGEEMMIGEESEELEKEVWGPYKEEQMGVEAKLTRGRGLYIPQGWWHSVKGCGEGVTASVNWWFR